MPVLGHFLRQPVPSSYRYPAYRYGFSTVPVSFRRFPKASYSYDATTAPVESVRAVTSPPVVGLVIVRLPASGHADRIVVGPVGIAHL